jgi:hypothetical protein
MKAYELFLVDYDFLGNEHDISSYADDFFRNASDLSVNACDHSLLASDHFLFAYNLFGKAGNHSPESIDFSMNVRVSLPIGPDF